MHLMYPYERHPRGRWGHGPSEDAKIVQGGPYRNLLRAPKPATSLGNGTQERGHNTDSHVGLWILCFGKYTSPHEPREVRTAPLRAGGFACLISHRFLSRDRGAEGTTPAHQPLRASFPTACLCITVYGFFPPRRVSHVFPPLVVALVYNLTKLGSSNLT